ncbi:rod shape-determining protein MreC [candidate division WWE3 bacterium]|uniref:Cell shape-determining protein MreC n=1 Tax=candidate division WWE3 bacterium TaxID=2053526 RepID=A0A955LL88_UNCKA|nr:rod shape-determining protein MreC [candidate division WWE3 bacterium]
MKRYYTLLFISILFMTASRVFSFDGIRSLGQSVLSPISFGLYRIGLATSGVVDFAVSIPSVYQDNNALGEKVISLEEQLIDLQSTKEENSILRQQLNVLGDRDEKTVLASVIGLNDQGRSVLVVINEGKRSGINIGQIVVNGGRLIGRVVEANANNAFVLPIFAVGSKVPVQVIHGEQKAIGLIEGEFNSKIVISDILQESEINAGDLVITSGEGGVYPSGLYVGRVGGILSSDSEIFKRLRLVPSWEFAGMHTVFVIVD